MKSLSVFVGTASNITYRNFRLEGVKSAVVLNMFKQGVGNTAATTDSTNSSSSSSSTTTTTTSRENATGSVGEIQTKKSIARNTVRAMPTAHNILIQNISGTANVAGKIACGEGGSVINAS
jgi:hypothetical protein